MSSGEDIDAELVGLAESDAGQVTIIHLMADEVINDLGTKVAEMTDATDAFTCEVDGREELIKLRRTRTGSTWDYSLTATPNDIPTDGFTTTFNDHGRKFWRAPARRVVGREEQQEMDRDELQKRLVCLFGIAKARQRD